MASQSRAAKASQKSLIHLACRVFQPRRRPAELIESRDRGVQVCLVEDLAAAEHVVFDRQHVDPAPLGVEALVRDPGRRPWVTTAPRSPSRCTAST